MGFFSDIMQSIPVNAVLRERITLAENKIKDLETENKKLKDQVAVLTTENEELKKKVAAFEATKQREEPEVHNGLYYFGGNRSQAYCPRCYEEKGKKHTMTNMRHMGQKCTVCGNHVLTH